MGAQYCGQLLYGFKILDPFTILKIETYTKQPEYKRKIDMKFKRLRAICKTDPTAFQTLVFGIPKS